MNKQLNLVSNKLRGITLIELMIALAISSILLLGVVSLYSSSKRTYTVDEEFARLQENARFALKFLIDDIRMAGYMGCAKNNEDLRLECDLTTTNNYICTGDNLVVRTGLEGFEAAGTGISSTPIVSTTAATADSHWTNGNATKIPSQLFSATPNEFSDILIVRHADDQGAKLTADNAATTLVITDGGSTGVSPCHTPSGLCANGIAVTSSCAKSRIFQVTTLTSASPSVTIGHNGTSAQGDTATGKIEWPANDFKAADTEVMPFMTFAYFVAQNPNRQPALFRHNGIATTEELVEGIENIQIAYGIDLPTLDGVANKYVPASAVNFSTDVIVSVRISILVRSSIEIGSYTAAAKSFPKMAGTTDVSSPSDKRLRQVFTTTIKLRNKGIKT